MNRKLTQHNLELLNTVATRFDDLCHEITFVGGCVLGLLVTDRAAPDVRFTVDVDCIINVITLANYYAFAEKLRKKGFNEIISGDHPICRWTCDGILIDIMPTDKKIFGFSNNWYMQARENAISVSINNVTKIKIISSPYFLGTKLDAFKDRGMQDFLSSHDLEDIISIIDGRPEIVNDISEASKDIKQYLSSEFYQLTENESFKQALPGHLNYTHELEARKQIVQERMHAIIDLGR